jgi:hypothetical protein
MILLGLDAGIPVRESTILCHYFVQQLENERRRVSPIII